MTVIMSREEIVQACLDWLEENLTEGSGGMSHEWLFYGEKPDDVRLMFAQPKAEAEPPSVPAVKREAL